MGLCQLMLVDLADLVQAGEAYGPHVKHLKKLSGNGEYVGSAQDPDWRRQEKHFFILSNSGTRRKMDVSTAL